MGVMTDATGRLLVNAVGGVDTAGLAKDSTLQAVNATLGQIKTAIDGLEPGSNVIYLYDRKTSSQAVTVPTNTHTTILQLSLAAGIWIINGTIFNPNLSGATGYRQVYLSNADDSASPFNSIETIQNAVVGTITATSVSGAIELTENSNIYLRFRHNQGDDITAFGILSAVRVG